MSTAENILNDENDLVYRSDDECDPRHQQMSQHCRPSQGHVTNTAPPDAAVNIIADELARMSIDPTPHQRQ